MSTPKVNTRRGEYTALLPQWERCRDAAAGSDAVKLAGMKYLPMLDSHYASVLKNAAGQLVNKYEEYKLRALFYNATGRTIQGLAGAVFQKTPVVVVPPAMDEHVLDVTLTGEPLEQFGLHAMKEFLTCGRAGILVDMSSKEAVNKRPYWVEFHAEDIVNWRHERMGGDDELSLVVLREYAETPEADDEFVVKRSEQYRVLRLSKEGIYTQQVYTAVQDKPTEWIAGEVLTPLRRGVPLDYIPFALPWAVMAPPLIDLVDVNLSHYRNAADLEHGLFKVGSPTPWVRGNLGDPSKPLYIGSGTAWVLGENGAAGMLEVQGPGFAALRLNMQDKQRMMATLGARLLEDQPSVNETAMAVSMRHAGDHASLRTVAQLVEQQLSWAMQVHGWWLGTEALVSEVEASIELNKEYAAIKASPEEVGKLMLLVQDDRISFATFYERLKAGGWTRDGIDAEQEQKEIAEQEVFRPAPIVVVPPVDEDEREPAA